MTKPDTKGHRLYDSLMLYVKFLERVKLKSPEKRLAVAPNWGWEEELTAESKTGLG